MPNPSSEDQQQRNVQAEPKDRFSAIPQHLQIEIIHSDDDIIVIRKPNNLRSVPGFAATNTDEASPKPSGNRRTGHEAWVLALQSFRNDKMLRSEQSRIANCLRAMASIPDNALQSIPRKHKPFCRYVQRNARRLFATSSDRHDNGDHAPQAAHENQELCNQVYQRIKQRQIPLINLPQVTKLEDSAVGQLTLLGYGGMPEAFNVDKSIHVVHRLDCETSGVMTFARNSAAASFLSKVWRERDGVHKTYIAEVSGWPPFAEKQQTEGEIRTFLAKSEESIKWKVMSNQQQQQQQQQEQQQSDDERCKESITKWALRASSCSESMKDGHIVLRLHPITGRTHQLRVHCAHVGNGIVGDSLYGDDKGKSDTGNLRLHASELSFPHPKDKIAVSFSSEPSWLHA